MTTSSKSEVAVGAILGETYEITRLLGEGGMGAVWEARHLRLPGKRFAVKVLHGHASADHEAYSRFRREAEIASRIGHPNIIEVLDWNTLPSGSPYLVLEFLDGEDLAGRLAGGPLSIEQSLAIAQQIGSALKAAHAAQVVHRDLKPGNVFLVPREVAGEITDHVKVLDFGISKIRNSQTVQTQDAVLLGTPQYMAPEQALGKNAEIDARTDVFAMATIVYEMISGKAPFEGSSLAQVVFKVVYEPVPPLSSVAPHVSPEISAAVERGMAKSATDRFPDVSSFVAALTGRALATTDRRAVRSSEVAVQVPPTAGRTDVVAVAPATGGLVASHLRGELQAQPEAKGGGKSLVFLLAAIVIGAGGTFGAVQLLRREPPTTSAVTNVDPPVAKTDPPVAKTDPPVAKTDPPVAKTDPSVAKTDPSVAKTDPPVAKTDPSVAAPAAGSGKKPGKVHAGASVGALTGAEPTEVKELLDHAEAALRRSDLTEARLMAERSLRIQKTSRAYAVLTRAHCSVGDLGNAKATYQHVSSSDRGRVRKECKAHEIEFD